MNPSYLKILLACGLGIGLCSVILLTGPEPLEASSAVGKPTVTVDALERAIVPSFIVAYGTLTPRQSLDLTTQVPGEVAWVHRKLVPGGLLDEGETLFRIDQRDYEIALASARARHAQAQANIDLEAGRSEIARLEWSAWRASEGVSDTELASPLALREPQKAEAASQQKVLLAELNRAELALERTAIRAPWAASVVQANAVVGQVLSVGDVIARLFPLDFAVVELQVPVSVLRALDAGIELVELRPVDDLSTKPVLGTFEGVVRSLTDDTRLATVRVRVDDPLEYDGWAYGMHVRANVETKQQLPVVLVPPELIVSGNLIWIYRDGQAQRLQVQPIEHSASTLFVEDNFLPGDALIIDRPIGLFDGAHVDAVNAEGA